MLIFTFTFVFKQAVLAEWIGALDSVTFVWEDTGSNPSVPNCSVWTGISGMTL